MASVHGASVQNVQSPFSMVDFRPSMSVIIHEELRKQNISLFFNDSTAEMFLKIEKSHFFSSA